MLNEYINTQSPIVASTGFLVGEEEKSDTLISFWQNTAVLLKFGYPTAKIAESMSSTSSEEKPEVPESPVTRQQPPAFPFYNEEDILNLDAAIVTPPPLQSGTIRIKLIYEEPSKPIPIENPWEE